MPYSFSMPKASTKQVHVLEKFVVQNIKHWQEYVSNLQRDLLTLEKVVSSLQKVKEEAQKEFKKVESQIKYHPMLISSREAKLTQLFEDHSALVKKVEDLRYQNNANETIQAAFDDRTKAFAKKS